ncbi:HAD family phosphatase [Streptomyces amakusaensis]|uniref:HAD family hydrolase n=1 Tax=Streptomyces amakusaensis TaxID=67271 RepID=A0ABW0ALK7_9ACTN
MLESRGRNWSPRAVVFDCDGTLMDSERHWVDARRQVLGEYGAVPDGEFWELSKGVHYTECGDLMAKVAGRKELAGRMTDQLLDAFRTLASGDPVVCPGASTVVEAAAGRLPLAVASNCPGDVVEACLGSAGLLGHFREVVVPVGRMRPKPHPDVYTHAADLLGVDPARCLAVEDSLCGIRSAVDAGMPVIGVGADPSPESAALADAWVESLEDEELAAWIARWGDQDHPPGG